MLETSPPTTNGRVAIISDTATLDQAAFDALERGGLQAEWSSRTDEASALFARTHVDLAMIDIHARGSQALICDTRRLHPGLPILAVGRGDDVAVRVAAFEWGADDFLAKPFAIPELVARCRALVRRARGPKWIADCDVDLGATASLPRGVGFRVATGISSPARS